MIDFTLSEMQDTVRQMVHWLAENEVRPLALEADRTHKIPDAFLLKMREMNISSGAIGKNYGGGGDEAHSGPVGSGPWLARLAGADLFHPRRLQYAARGHGRGARCGRVRDSAVGAARVRRRDLAEPQSAPRDE